MAEENEQGIEEGADEETVIPPLPDDSESDDLGPAVAGSDAAVAEKLGAEDDALQDEMEDEDDEEAEGAA